MMPALLVGLLFLVGGALVRPRPSPDETCTWGRVVESWTGPAFGEPAWLCTVEFSAADGSLWRFQPPLSSARRRVVGTPVLVAYSPAYPPGTARKVDGLDGAVHWVLVGTGAAVMAGALLLG